MSRGPVEIGGVLAFPNEDGNREIRFIDSDYNPLFTVPDGEHIVRTYLDGRQDVLQCEYIDDYHARIGGTVCHIHQFAELQEQRSILYAPEHPRAGDICDTYTIYQIKDARTVGYSCQPYHKAKGKVRREDYRKAYACVLAPEVTPADLFAKHIWDNGITPSGQKHYFLSVSDIVVLNRGGVETALYTDRFDFSEVKEFLRPRLPGKQKSDPKRRRGGESR